MDKFYNLKQETVLEASAAFEQLDEMEFSSKKDRRKNEILNGFIFIIGIVGFLAAFWLPRDLVYNRSSLEHSFSNNSSPLASSSLPATPLQTKNDILNNFDNQFHIVGYLEADEVLEFRLDNFQQSSEVVFDIHFGNGQKKKIESNSTYYKYPSSGLYEIKVTATYKGESKEMIKKKVKIEEAIIVNSEAFLES